MINLWYDEHAYDYLQGRMSGPPKVRLNLKKSLEESNIKYVVNQDVYEKNFMLEYDVNLYKIHEKLEHQSCFIGPHFWPFETYGKFLVDNPQYYNQLIVPSQWVKDLLLLKFGVNENKVSVWPVGIGKFDIQKSITYDCLVYFKRRKNNELEKCIKFLEEKNLSYKIISYGDYDESTFKSLLSQSKFCFLINGSESQGIAVQEIMNSNTPLFVWDISEWLDQGEEYKVPATSVPYWDERCGEKFYFESEMEKVFSKFYDRIETYKPKKFIEQNLSFQKSAEILLEILNAS